MSTSCALALRLLTSANATRPSAAERCVANSLAPHSRATFDRLREDLLSVYLERTPSAQRAIELLAARGARSVYNDHIAMRSFVDGAGRSGLAWLRRLFLHFGFAEQPPIVIPSLPVNAVWLEPPGTTDWPKIFISELRTSELPEPAASAIFSILGDHYERLDAAASAALNRSDDPEDSSAALLDLLDTPRWSLSSDAERAVRAVGHRSPEHAAAAEYAAWSLMHGHRVNHMTILLNSLALPAVSSLSDLNELLRHGGFVFNAAGGTDGYTQGSAATLLEQSSTVADTIEHDFSCGTRRRVPCAFLELIHRHGGFGGFLGQNAKGIFSSTNQKR